MNDQDQAEPNPYSLQSSQRPLRTKNTHEEQESPGSSPTKLIKKSNHQNDLNPNSLPGPGHQPRIDGADGLFAEVSSTYKDHPRLNKDLLPQGSGTATPAAANTQADNEQIPVIPPTRQPRCPRLTACWETYEAYVEAPVYFMIMLLVPFFLIQVLRISAQIYWMYPVKSGPLPNYESNWNKDSIFGLSATAYPDLPEPQNMFYVEQVTGIWPANTDGCLCPDDKDPNCFTKPRLCNFKEQQRDQRQVPNKQGQIIKYWDNRQMWAIRGYKTSMIDHMNNQGEDGQCKSGYKACPSDALKGVFCIDSKFSVCPITKIAVSKGSEADESTGILTPDGKTIYISRAEKKTPIAELLYSFGSLCMDRDQGTFLPSEHVLSKYGLFLNGKHSQRNFGCLEDKSGIVIASSSAQGSLGPSKIITNHLHRFNLLGSTQISLLAYNLHPWDQSCGKIAELPGKADSHAKARQNSFYWILFYISLSLLCWSLSRVQIYFTRSNLKKNTLENLRSNSEFVKTKIGKNGNKDLREKVLDKLEKHQMAKVAAFLFSVLISGSDIYVLFSAYSKFPDLIEDSSTLSKTFLAFSACFETLSPVLQSESAILMKPQALKNSLNTFFFLAFGLRLIVLFWNPISFFLSDKYFEEALENVKAIDPEASVIKKISDVFWNIIKGTHQVASIPSGADDAEDRTPLKSELRVSTNSKKQENILRVSQTGSQPPKHSNSLEISADDPTARHPLRPPGQPLQDQPGTTENEPSASVFEQHVPLPVAAREQPDPQQAERPDPVYSQRDVAVELQPLTASAQAVCDLPVPQE